MRQPGRWLRAVAARLCARQTMERVIDPVIADVQTEYDEAVRARGWRRALRVRIAGYSAFWKTVGLHTLQSGPRSLWSSVAADGSALGRTMACALIVSVGVTLLLTAAPMFGFYSRTRLDLTLTLLLLPQAIPLSIPMALPVGIAYGLHGTRAAARRMRGVLLLAIVATLLAFGAMLMVPAANQAFRVALANELGMRGVTTYSLPRGVNELSLSELASRSQAYDADGLSQQARQFRRGYHSRLALPAATFVLSLLALAICGALQGRARRVVAIVITLFLYWATLAAAEWSSSLPAALSVWAPNIAFTAIALALLAVTPAKRDVERSSAAG